MAWYRVLIPASREEAERLSDRLLELGALSVSFEDAGDEPQFEPGRGEMPLWVESLVIGLYPATGSATALVERLQRASVLHAFRGRLEARVESFTESDLEANRVAHAQPTTVGARTWVGPDDAEPPANRDIVIRLAPGLAFGTGRHPTTALCLAALEECDVWDATVIDYGCGSGILSIAAIRLGAKKVWALDIDPQACFATRTNADRNGVGARIAVAQSPNELPESVDIVVANILAKPLLDLAPAFARLIRPGGTVVLSGVLSAQTADIRQRYQTWFDCDQPVVSGDWGLCVGVRNTDLVQAE
ncbi:MAG: 50S ribosomal protein L11 methyltransferase [Pseudomonadota bacterium]